MGSFEIYLYDTKIECCLVHSFTNVRMVSVCLGFVYSKKVTVEYAIVLILSWTFVSVAKRAILPDNLLLD